MTAFTVASIVEGQGDVAAVPLLLRRLHPQWNYARPIRVNRYRLVKPGVLEHYLFIAEANILESGTRGAVLILIDAEQECPATLGPQLLARASNSLHHRESRVVLAKTMFETWLVAGGCAGKSPPDPEAVANPKKLLRDALGRYGETADQPRLASQMNVTRAAELCPSLRKLQRSLSNLSIP